MCYKLREPREIAPRVLALFSSFQQEPRTAQKWENIAWRDIEDYRFEACDAAPNLRVLVVEARGRKAPLRLYYEGEQLQERLDNAMTLGLASTRTSIPQGKQLLP